MKTSKPIQQYSFRPFHRGTLRFDVRIFRTKKHMYSWFRWFERHRKHVGCNFEAIVLSRHTVDCRGPVPRSRPHVATMLFVRSRMQMSIVTHESGHAALAWFRRKYWNRRSVDINADMKIEEEFCYVLGEIGRQIVSRTR